MNKNTMQHSDSASALMLLQYGGDDSDEDNSFNEPEAKSPTRPPAQPPAAEKKSPERKRRHSSDRRSGSRSPGRRVSEDSVGKHSSGLISDEEIDHTIPERSRKRSHEDDGQDEAPFPLKMKLEDVSRNMAPSVSSNDSPYMSDSQLSKTSQKKSKPATMRLVSYGTDELEEDEVESEEEEDEEDIEEKPESDTQETSESYPRLGGLFSDIDNIQLPPAPSQRCSKALQEKITEFTRRKHQQNFNTNHEIQNLTSFRNPSIYEKLIQLYHVNEKGTNFPVEVFNPNLWGKDSFYDELDKLQKKDMERREKEKKTKIEFLSGTKKSNTSSDSSSSAAANDDRKRKSKWDALPTGSHHAGQPQRVSGNSSVSNLTSSATGTRATVISAVGTLNRKASYNIISQSGPPK